MSDETSSAYGLEKGRINIVYNISRSRSQIATKNGIGAQGETDITKRMLAMNQNLWFKRISLNPYG